jgi:hypothetical protein
MSLSHRSWLSLAAASALVACHAGIPLAALHAAGLVGIAPHNGGVISGLIRTLQGNVIWLIVTGFSLVLAIIGFTMFFGSQRAMEYLAKVILGIALILVVAPAALA